MLRLFFATDIHGSDICWKKFLNAGKFYQANVLVLGDHIHEAKGAVRLKQTLDKEIPVE